LRRRLPFILLAAVLALSFGLNARVAANPRSAYQSADERSYGKLAVDIADNQHYGGTSTGMREPLHWPPGAPLLFAAGYKLTGTQHDFDIPAVYWQQAVLTTGTTALAAILVWLLAGPWAGVLAGLIVGTYPPLIGATGDQLSEPLGAFLLIAAFTVLALALRRGRRALFAAAGALFGLAILTRTDLLPVPFLIAGAATALALLRRKPRRAAPYVVLAGAAALVLAPWTIYASHQEGRFIPVTKGSAAALFVGTYLPGGGTTIGMKEHLEPQLRARHPEYKGLKTYKIPAADALEIFAERHPDLSRDEAIQTEARKNLVHYSTTQPLAFAKMQWAKAKRMWFFYYRGGGVHYISTPMRIWQVFLVIAGGAGILAGLIRRRGDPLLAAVLITLAYSTLIHTIVVSQARYNLPLMPSLIAAGVTGWFLALRRRPAPEPETARMPAWKSEPSASGAASVTAPAA
jgi:4-amino-4-deoxy-L-arabinose transferase-like glycosyltransferase